MPTWIGSILPFFKKKTSRRLKKAKASAKQDKHPLWGQLHPLTEANFHQTTKALPLFQLTNHLAVKFSTLIRLPNEFVKLYFTCKKIYVCIHKLVNSPLSVGTITDAIHGPRLEGARTGVVIVHWSKQSSSISCILFYPSRDRVTVKALREGNNELLRVDVSIPAFTLPLQPEARSFS